MEQALTSKNSDHQTLHETSKTIVLPHKIHTIKHWLRPEELLVSLEFGAKERQRQFMIWTTLNTVLAESASLGNVDLALTVLQNKRYANVSPFSLS